MWKRQYISKDERVMLIGSTLSSLLIYLLSLFYLPRTVRLRCDQIRRRFLWEGGNLDKKPHLVE